MAATAERTIEAIEQFYSGVTFRSRLEARWSIFFDAVGIAWQYEPRWINHPNADGEIGYLPDFYLPELLTPDGERGVFVEVKPTDELLERERYGRLIDYNGPLANLLLLGEIPQPRGVTVCHSFCSWDDGVVCRQVRFTKRRLIHEPLAYPGEDSVASDAIPDGASCLPSWLMIHSGRHAESDDIGKINNVVHYNSTPELAAAYLQARTHRFPEVLLG